MAGDARVAHAGDATTVVASYCERLGEIGLADAGPAVRVYGDGRVEAHYPAYMKDGGDHVGRLSPPELEALLVSLADAGVLDFDADAVGAAKRDAARARRNAAALSGRPATIALVADADTVTIELNLDRGHKKIEWEGIQHDARAYPEVPALHGLAVAEQRLRAVMERAAGRAGR